MITSNRRSAFTTTTSNDIASASIKAMVSPVLELSCLSLYASSTTTYWNRNEKNSTITMITTNSIYDTTLLRKE